MRRRRGAAIAHGCKTTTDGKSSINLRLLLALEDLITREVIDERSSLLHVESRIFDGVAGGAKARIPYKDASLRCRPARNGCRDVCDAWRTRFKLAISIVKSVHGVEIEASLVAPRLSFQRAHSVARRSLTELQ